MAPTRYAGKAASCAGALSLGQAEPQQRCRDRADDPAAQIRFGVADMLHHQFAEQSAAGGAQCRASRPSRLAPGCSVRCRALHPPARSASGRRTAPCRNRRTPARRPARTARRRARSAPPAPATPQIRPPSAGDGPGHRRACPPEWMPRACQAGPRRSAPRSARDRTRSVRAQLLPDQRQQWCIGQFVEKAARREHQQRAASQ